MVDRITSPANTKLRYVRRLAHGAFRRRERRLVLEGVRLVEEALAAGAVVDFALMTDDLARTERGRALVELLEGTGAPVHRLDAKLLGGVADTETPQGVLAVAEEPELERAVPSDLLLVLDGVRDPGNLGTCVRSAWAAGASAVAVTPGTVDMCGPKTVRAAAGAHFRIPMLRLSRDRLATLVRDEALDLWVADARGDVAYTDVDWRRRAAVVVGSEAHGATPEMLAIGRGVSIPMPGGAESLNAAVAAAVILFEATRQRRAAMPSQAPRRAHDSV